MCAIRVRSVYRREFSIETPARRASSSASWMSASSNRRPPSALASVSVPERPTARGHRRDDQRAQAEPPDEVELVGVLEAGDEHRVGDLADERGLAAPHHGQGPGGRLGIGREALAELARHRALGRIDVRRRDLAHPPGLVEDAHGAPLGDLGDRDVRHVRQRLLEVERGVEDRSRAREEVGPQPGVALGLEQRATLGDVDDGDADPDHGLAVEAAHRRQRRDPVPRLARRARRLAAALAVQARLAGGDHLAVHARELLAQRPRDLLDEAAHVVLHGASVHGGEGLVDADVAALGVEERESDGGRRDQRVEQAEGALGGLVEARVVDRQGEALAERLREDDVLLAVVTALAGRQQGERADHATARAERDDEVRARAEPLDVRALALVQVGRVGARDVGGQDRAAAAEHLQGLGAVLLARGAAGGSRRACARGRGRRGGS